MQVSLPPRFAEVIVTIVAFFLFFCFSVYIWYINTTCVCYFFRKAFLLRTTWQLPSWWNKVLLLLLLLLVSIVTGLHCIHFVFSQESYCLKVTQKKTFPILKKVILLFPMNQTLQNVMHWRVHFGNWKLSKAIIIQEFHHSWKCFRSHSVPWKQTSRSILMRIMINCSRSNAERLQRKMQFWSFKFLRDYLVRAC